jgi:hypothetical protein
VKAKSAVENVKVGNYRHVTLLMHEINELHTADLIQICTREVPASILIQFCRLLKERRQTSYSNKQGTSSFKIYYLLITNH